MAMRGLSWGFNPVKHWKWRKWPGTQRQKERLVVQVAPRDVPILLPVMEMPPVMQKMPVCKSFHLPIRYLVFKVVSPRKNCDFLFLVIISSPLQDNSCAVLPRASAVFGALREGNDFEKCSVSWSKRKCEQFGNVSRWKVPQFHLCCYCNVLNFKAEPGKTTIIAIITSIQG